VTQIVHDLAVLVGLGSSAVGMTGIVSRTDRQVHVLGFACIAVGVATILAASLDVLA
jgi:hypothetical protein